TIPRTRPIAMGRAAWLSRRINRFAFGGRKSRVIRRAHDARFGRSSHSRFGRPRPRERAAQVRTGVEVLAVEGVQAMPVGMPVVVGGEEAVLMTRERPGVDGIDLAAWRVLLPLRDRPIAISFTAAIILSAVHEDHQLR